MVNESNHWFDQSLPFWTLCKPSKFSYNKYLLFFFSQILEKFGQSIIPMIIFCFIMFGILGVIIECLGMMETSGNRSHLEKPSESWQWHFKGFDLTKLSTIQSPTGPLKWPRCLIKLRWSYKRMFGVGWRQASHDTRSEAVILFLMAPRIWQNVTFTASNHLTGLSLSAAQLQTEVTKHGHEVVKNPLPLSGWFSGWNSSPCSEFTHTEKECTSVYYFCLAEGHQGLLQRDQPDCEMSCWN